MVDESQPRSIRLNQEEIDFLKKQNISLSELTKEAIQTKKDKVKILSKKEKINKVISNGFFVMLGMLFFMMLGPMNDIISIAIIAGMGLLFTIFGSVNLYLTIKGDNIFERKK